MRVGFTGSHRGMTEHQRRVLRYRLAELRPIALIHGGCVGADDTADQLACQLGIDRFIYPSTRLNKSVPFTTILTRQGSRALIGPRDEPLARNARIVENCSVLLACPSSKTETVRSGTWATVRMARRLRIPVEVIEP